VVFSWGGPLLFRLLSSYEITSHLTVLNTMGSFEEMALFASATLAKVRNA